MDTLFRANIDLLIIYTYIKERNDHTVSELPNIYKLFNEGQSERGMAIVNLFLAFSYNS